MPELLLHHCKVVETKVRKSVHEVIWTLVETILAEAQEQRAKLKNWESQEILRRLLMLYRRYLYSYIKAR